MIDGFEIVKPGNIVESLKKHRDNYYKKGKYLGFRLLDNYYTMQLGTCTDWTGFPRSGKTQILMELLLNTSMFYHWRHLVYFPDVGNSTEIIADLLHKKTGKSFAPGRENSISDQEIQEHIDWLLYHFKILTKKNVKAKLSPFEFWDYAVELKKTEGLETGCIDAWKDMNHPYEKYGGYAQYLEVVLPYRNQIAEDNNLHLHTVIHPKLTEKVKGVRKAPTPYDLKGGSEWFNSGKCMITVHREDVTSDEVELMFHKMKPRSTGNVGSCSLKFDLDRFVYYHEGEMFERFYAAKKGKEKGEIHDLSPLPESDEEFDPQKDELPF